MRVGALLSIVSVPLNVPGAVGAKFTVTEQVAAGASDEHAFVSVRLASPVSEIFVTVRVA